MLRLLRLDTRNDNRVHHRGLVLGKHLDLLGIRSPVRNGGRFLNREIGLAFDGIDHGQSVHTEIRAETGKRVGEHRTQLADTLRDLRLTILQIGDALLHALHLASGGLTTLVDLRVGLFGGLLDDVGGLAIGGFTLLGGVLLGLATGALGRGDQLVGLLLGGLATLVKIGQQLIDLLRGLILLGGDVGTNLLHFGIDLADGLGPIHLGIVGKLLRLRLRGIGDLGCAALRIGQHLGDLFAHVGQLPVGLGKRGFDLIVGIALESGNLLVRALTLGRDLLGGLGAHVGNLSLLRSPFGCEFLFMLLAGVGELEVESLTLGHHVLLRIATQPIGLTLSGGLDGFRVLVGLRQHRRSLGIGFVKNTLGVHLGVVQQGFRLQLHGRTGGGRVLLGTVEQFGAGLLGAGQHLLRVGAQRGERVRIGLLVLLFLKLGLQFKNRLVIRLDLFTKTSHRLLG